MGALEEGRRDVEFDVAVSTDGEEGKGEAVFAAAGEAISSTFAPFLGGGLRRSTLTVADAPAAETMVAGATDSDDWGSASTKFVSVFQFAISEASVALAVILSPVTVL